MAFHVKETVSQENNKKGFHRRQERKLRESGRGSTVQEIQQHHLEKHASTHKSDLAAVPQQLAT